MLLYLFVFGAFETQCFGISWYNSALKSGVLRRTCGYPEQILNHLAPGTTKSCNFEFGNPRKSGLIQVILWFDQIWIDDHGCGSTKLATNFFCITYFFIKPWAVIYPWKPMFYPSKPEVPFPAKRFIETHPHKPLICQRFLQIWKRCITLNQECLSY